ncbi:lipoprotein [Micromonospora sp. RL09-050-HVF-A]|nr:lipoprotein [Micromonospora sp. RL09-050-HVF-A]
MRRLLAALLAVLVLAGCSAGPTGETAPVLAGGASTLPGPVPADLALRPPPGTAPAAPRSPVRSPTAPRSPPPGCGRTGRWCSPSSVPGAPPASPGRTR